MSYYFRFWIDYHTYKCIRTLEIRFQQEKRLPFYKRPRYCKTENLNILYINTTV